MKEKNLTVNNLFKKSSVIVGIEVFATLVIVGLLIYVLILPKYKSLRGAAKQSEETKGRVEKVTKSIEALQKLDSTSLKEASAFLDRFLPVEEDQLRFISLAEEVAGVSGVELSAAQVQTGDKRKTAASTSRPAGVSPSLSSGSGSVQTPSTTASTSKTTTTAKKKDLTIKLSFEVTYSSLLTLLTNFEKIDRAAVITNVDLSGGGETGAGITASISITLPFFASAPAASAENVVVLTSSEEKALESLISKVQITTAPAKSPLGRPEPFN